MNSFDLWSLRDFFKLNQPNTPIFHPNPSNPAPSDRLTHPHHNFLSHDLFPFLSLVCVFANLNCNNNFPCHFHRATAQTRSGAEMLARLLIAICGPKFISGMRQTRESARENSRVFPFSIWLLSISTRVLWVTHLARIFIYFDLRAGDHESSFFLGWPSDLIWSCSVGLW
jgi:hypothetical protein